MKTLLLTLAFILAFCYLEGQSFQVEINSVLENEKVTIEEIVVTSNGENVFAGNISINGIQSPVIGTLTDNGSIAEAQLLKIPSTFGNETSAKVTELLAHAGNEISIVVEILFNTFLLRLDSDFNVIYARVFDFPFEDTRKIISDDLGNTYVNAEYFSSPSLVKLNPTGEKIWSIAMNVSRFLDMGILSNGNLVLSFIEPNNPDMGIIVIDQNNGEVLLTKTCNVYSYYFEIDDFDNIYFYRYQNSGSTELDTAEGVLFKLDSNFDLVWSKTLNLDSELFLSNDEMMKVDQDNNVIVLGYQKETVGITILKVSTSGEEIYRKLLADQSLQSASSIFPKEEHYLITVNSFDSENPRILKSDLSANLGECESIQLCSEFSSAEVVIGSNDSPTNIPSNFQVSVNTEGFTFETFAISAQQVCTTSLSTTAEFTLVNEPYCVDNILEFAQESISIFGISTWRIESPTFTDTISQKFLEGIVLNEAGLWSLTHILEINGCKDSTTYSFTVISPNSGDRLEDTYFICDDEIVDLELPISISEITWSNGDTNNNTTIAESGVYSVTYVDEAECDQEESFEVTKDFTPQVSISTDSVLCLDDFREISFTGSNIDTFYWNDGSTLPTKRVEKTGLYTIFVENECGLSFAENYTEFKKCEPKVYIPNVFSPNGDGINDIFEIFGTFIEIEQCSIFDRWGNLVYRSTDDVSWDGSSLDQEVSQGTYSYIIELTDRKSNSFFRQGTISVIK